LREKDRNIERKCLKKKERAAEKEVEKDIEG
jgi:hypothetical protein